MKAKSLVFFLFSTVAPLATALPLMGGGDDVQDSLHKANITTETLEARGLRLSVVLAMGNQKRNVGTMIGSQAYGVVYNALNSLCPPETSTCSTRTLYPVQIAFTRDGRLQHDYLSIAPFRANWKHPNNLLLRSTMIGAIAAAAEQMTLDAKNCHDAGEGRNCNMADFIGVTVGEGDEAAYMDIHFYGSGDQGHFDCVAVIEAVDNIIKNTEQDYLQAMGTGYERVDRKTWCLNTDVT